MMTLMASSPPFRQMRSAGAAGSCYGLEPVRYNLCGPRTLEASILTKSVVHEIRDEETAVSTPKRNVTITLTEDVARWARVRAAEHDTSVSQFVGELLSERMAEETSYQAAMQQYLSLQPRALKPSEAEYPARDELHERHRIR